MPGELIVCLYAVFGGRQFVCVHSVQRNTVCPCAMSGGTSFVCVCMRAQYLVGTSHVCVVSGGTSRVYCVWWYKACVYTVSGEYITCVSSVWWYIMCAVSGGTRCMRAQNLVGTSFVCVVSGGTRHVRAQCLVVHHLCVQCPVVQIMCVCTCAHTLVQYLVVHCLCAKCMVIQCAYVYVCVCVCVCGGGAVSGGTRYVCGVQDLVENPVQSRISQNNHQTKNQNRSRLAQSGPNSLYNFRSAQNL